MGTDEDIEPEPLVQTADDRFAENFRKRRDLQGLSQADVAEKMTERGFAFHQQTVAKIERGTRRVGIGEAVELANILDLSVDALLIPTDLAMTESHLYSESRKLEKLHEQIVQTSMELMKLHFRVSGTIRMAQRYADQGRVKRAISMAERSLNRTPDAALIKAIEKLTVESMHRAEDLDDQLDQGTAAARRLYGDRPVNDEAQKFFEVNNLTSLLVRRYRRLWWDPRSFLKQHLILVEKLMDAGVPASAIGRSIGMTPEFVEAMAADGRALWEIVPEAELDTRFARDAGSGEDRKES